MKKTLAILLACVFVFSMTFTATAAETYPAAKVSVNGQEVAWVDQGPINIAGMVFVPIRETLEAFGQEVEWINETKTVETTDAVTDLWVKLDLSSATVSTSQFEVERTYEMVTAPKLINGKTMVSIRALTEIYGKEVSYDAATATVLVNDMAADTTKAVQLDAAKTYEGFVGDIVKVHCAASETLEYTTAANKDFVYVTCEEETDGAICMYFKAVTANKGASIVINTVDGEKVTPQTYKANIADPTATAVALTTEKGTIAKAGTYVKVVLAKPEAATGQSWFITALPANLVKVSETEAASDITYVFYVKADTDASLKFDKMTDWGTASVEAASFLIQTEEGAKAAEEAAKAAETTTDGAITTTDGAITTTDGAVTTDDENKD